MSKRKSVGESEGKNAAEKISRRVVDFLLEEERTTAVMQAHIREAYKSMDLALKIMIQREKRIKHLLQGVVGTEDSSMFKMPAIPEQRSGVPIDHDEYFAL